MLVNIGGQEPALTADQGGAAWGRSVIANRGEPVVRLVPICADPAAKSESGNARADSSTGSKATRCRPMRDARRRKSMPPSRRNGAHGTDLSRCLPADLAGRASHPPGRSVGSAIRVAIRGSFRHFAAGQARMPGRADQARRPGPVSAHTWNCSNVSGNGDGRGRMTCSCAAARPFRSRNAGCATPRLRSAPWLRCPVDE